MTKTWTSSSATILKNSVERLELPTAFSLQLQGALPEREFLRDRYTNLWPVKMAKIEKAVHDNHVESGDVFVFQYDGTNLFDVKLLGLSDYDKWGFGQFNIGVEDEHEEDGEARVELLEQVAADGASEEDDVDNDKDDTNDYIQVEEAENKTEEDSDVKADQPQPLLQYSWQSARPMHIKCT